ncbi:MAG: chorismate lyase / 3-hydroxybenzoate synthase, partial [Humisphaera sp.]|nr:chorismate lyase / 3-hydroxybenzoate synthase [Humisphaera sp.]
PPESFSLISARVRDVAALTPGQFEQQTFEAYVSIAEQLASPRCANRHPVRFWNHVPFITDPADAGRDNYMVFNAGRFRAFSDWYGGAARFERDVATASATGHWGRDLLVHCLASDTAGAAINNPRQVAPYHYSQRFGPLPPCFARATRLAADNLLLVGGTASVRGEDSVHVDDLASQCRETCVNLAALVSAAVGKKLTPSLKLPRLLSAFRDLRVYHSDRAREHELERSIRENFPGLRRLEMLHADLCRAELLVEIEGVADLSELTNS